MKYPWVIPYLNGNEKSLVSEAVASTWISGGPYVNSLEAGLTKLLGASTLCVSNGTTALECAFRSLNVKSGDEVIVPDFSFIAPAAMVRSVGADVVLADIDINTWCLDAADVERKINSKTKAIVAVHTYGNCADMDRLKRICTEKKILLIEDTAEAFLSSYNGKKLGTIGDIGTYSFHATKTLTTGEGGAVSFSKPEVLANAKQIRDHGMAKRYWHPVVGSNFRMTNMQAAMGCAQLETINWVCQQRESMYQNYQEAISTDKRLTPQTLTAGVKPVMWAVAVVINDISETQRDQLIEALKQDGIETRPGFYPASKMPPYQNASGAKNCPNAKFVSERIIALPFYIGLTREDIQWITSRLSQNLNLLT